MNEAKTISRFPVKLTVILVLAAFLIGVAVGTWVEFERHDAEIQLLLQKARKDAERLDLDVDAVVSALRYGDIQIIGLTVESLRLSQRIRNAETLEELENLQRQWDEIKSQIQKSLRAEKDKASDDDTNPTGKPE